MDDFEKNALIVLIQDLASDLRSERLLSDVFWFALFILFCILLCVR